MTEANMRMIAHEKKFILTMAWIARIGNGKTITTFV